MAYDPTQWHILINDQNGSLQNAVQLKNAVRTLRSVSVQVDELLRTMQSGLNTGATEAEGEEYVRANWGIPDDTATANLGNNVTEVVDLLTQTRQALQHAKVTETLERIQ